MNNQIKNNHLLFTQEQTLQLIKTAMQMGQVRSLALPDAYEIFITLKKAAGTRDATIKYYKDTFKLLTKYFTPLNILETCQITDEVVTKYITLMFNANLSKGTINKRIGTITHLIHLLAERNYIDDVKFSFKKMKETIKEIETIPNEQLKELSEYVATKPTIQQVLFRIIIETGVRRTECINIKSNNINLETGEIYLEHTKNGDERYIFVSVTTLELIKLVLSGNKDKPFLFYNHDLDRKMSTSFVDSFFLRAKKDLGFKNLGPHLLRHTYCTALAHSNELDYKSLQILMGHKTMSMTLRYIHSKTDKLAAFSTKLNPLSQME